VTRTWHLLTGEYPPDRGGVGDYTSCLARALADAGCAVHVWCGGSAGESDEGGVRVHRVASAFDGDGLRRLAAGLDAIPGPRTLLVQYAPRAFGRDGTNVAFCWWVLGRREVDDVRVMFHEPFFPFGIQPLRRNALALANHAMAWLLLRAAHRAYVSIPAWEKLLWPVTPRRLKGLAWLPVGSTIRRVDDSAAVDALRRRIARGGRPVVAHFGTYGGLLRDGLRTALSGVMAGADDAVLLLLGDGGPAFGDELAAGDGAIRSRIVAPGWLPSDALSLHLQAADLAVQPYPDGASSRRTTLMAALSHGIPVVTTRGRFTEDVWTGAGVRLADADRPADVSAEALRLLRDAPARMRAAKAGERLYAEHFAIERAVDVLLDRTEDGDGMPATASSHGPAADGVGK
jgi:glycosyltransferase involved in cell wall biosynthesis